MGGAILAAGGRCRCLRGTHSRPQSPTGSRRNCGSTPSRRRRTRRTPGPGRWDSGGLRRRSRLLRQPAWLSEEATRSIQIDGEIITIGFDPRPGGAPHSILALVEMPASLITPGGSPDPQATQEQIGGMEVTVICRGENCMTFEWEFDDLYLQHQDSGLLLSCQPFSLAIGSSHYLGCPTGIRYNGR